MRGHVGMVFTKFFSACITCNECMNVGCMSIYSTVYVYHDREPCKNGRTD